MYGFGAFGEYAYGEMKPSTTQVVSVAVGLAVALASLGAATAAEHPPVTIAARAGETAVPHGVENAPAALALGASETAAAKAKGARNLTIAAVPSIVPALHQIERVSAPTLAAAARVSESATTSMPKQRTLAASAGESAAPGARGAAIVGLGMLATLTDGLRIAALRGLALAAKANAAEVTSALERTAATLAAAFAAAGRATGAGHAAAGLAATARAPTASIRAVEPASILIAAAAGASDRAPAEREPVTSVAIGMTASLTATVRAVEGIAAPLAARFGDDPHGAQSIFEAVAFGTHEGLSPTAHAVGHGTAEIDARATDAAVPRRRDLVGRAVDIAARLAPAEAASAHGAAGFGAHEQIGAGADAMQPTMARLALTAGAAARGEGAEQVSASLSIRAAQAGRFSVSIFARSLGVAAGQGAAPAAHARAAADLGAAAGSANATPSPRATRGAQIVAALGVLPAMLGAARVTRALSLVAAWSAARFFDLRLARKLTGRGSRAAFTGAAARSRIDGRASGARFTGKEV